MTEMWPVKRGKPIAQKSLQLRLYAHEAGSQKLAFGSNSLAVLTLSFAKSLNVCGLFAVGMPRINGYYQK